MSPELEKLIEAYDAKRTCPPEEKPQYLATFERLLTDALSRQPGASREALLEAKVGVGTMREALAGSERELVLERRQLEDAERRGRLAAAVPDPETVTIAERFAVRGDSLTRPPLLVRLGYLSVANHDDIGSILGCRDG